MDEWADVVGEDEQTLDADPPDELPGPGGGDRGPGKDSRKGFLKQQQQQC